MPLAVSVIRSFRRVAATAGGRMSFQLQFEEMSGYLVAKFIGSGGLIGLSVAEEIWRQFELIAEHCKRTKNDKILIDTTRADGKVSFVERFLLGERAQVFASYRLKVAVVDGLERIDPQKFGELVARNRGVNVRIFSDFQGAKEWLLE
jgi:hypothetical protein